MRPPPLASTAAYRPMQTATGLIKQEKNLNEHAMPNLFKAQNGRPELQAYEQVDPHLAH